MARRFRCRRLVAALSCGALLVGFANGTASAHTSHAPVVVVSGLNNPREVDWMGGKLLIAEAGKGGTLFQSTGPDGSASGLGYTGSVSVAWANGHGQSPHRIVTGLLSAAGLDGSGAVGSDGVAATSLNKIAIIETTFGPGLPEPAAARDGHVLIASHGNIRPLADITGFEINHDPDGQGLDSDPYAIMNYGGGWLVADAAGNDLLRVDQWGHVSLFHVFANITTGDCGAPGVEDPPGFPGCNFVPTSLDTDSAGNIYVGALASEVPGAGEVVELNRHGHVLRTWTGLTTVTGVERGWDGALYVSQLEAPGSDPNGFPGVVTQIRGSHRTSIDVPFPGGLSSDPSGNVYVSAFSIAPDTGLGAPDSSGQIWRLRF